MFFLEPILTENLSKSLPLTSKMILRWCTQDQKAVPHERICSVSDCAGRDTASMISTDFFACLPSTSIGFNASFGHARKHSPQRTQRRRNSRSETAPGGRTTGSEASADAAEIRPSAVPPTAVAASPPNKANARRRSRVFDSSELVGAPEPFALFGFARPTDPNEIARRGQTSAQFPQEAQFAPI